MTNRYAGKCYKCRRAVEPGAGRCWKFRGRWYVACSECSGPKDEAGTSAPKREVSSAPKPPVYPLDRIVPPAAKCRSRRELMARYLLACGYHVEAEGHKRWVLAKPGKADKYFLGGQGGVRCGPCVTKSFSRTDETRWDTVKAEVKKLAAEEAKAKADQVPTGGLFAGNEGSVGPGEAVVVENPFGVNLGRTVVDYSGAEGEERASWDRAYYRGGARFPCPTCGEPDRITAKGRSLGHQCDSCADNAEAGVPGY